MTQEPAQIPRAKAIGSQEDRCACWARHRRRALPEEQRASEAAAIAPVPACNYRDPTGAFQLVKLLDPCDIAVKLAVGGLLEKSIWIEDV